MLDFFKASQTFYFVIKILIKVKHFQQIFRLNQIYKKFSFIIVFFNITRKT